MQTLISGDHKRVDCEAGNLINFVQAPMSHNPLFHQFHCHYSLYYHYSTYLYPGDLVSVVMHIPTPTQSCQLWV